MIQAYLLINLDTEKTNDNILESIREIDEVLEAHRVYGTYDILILIQATSPEHLKELTLQSVRQLQFVESTVTFIALDYYTK